MKYLLFIIVLLMMLLGCGKKGPIELPTGYHDDTIQNAEKLDPPIVPVAEGTNIHDFNLVSSGTLWMGFSQNREIRTLLRYSLSSITDLDLSTTTLSMKMTIDRLVITAPIVLRFYRLTKKWDRYTVNWSDSETDIQWDDEGADYTPIDSFSVTVNPGDTEIVISDALIRPIVSYWRDHSEENYGLIIVPDAATPKAMEIVAVLNASVGDENTWPILQYTVGSESKYLIPAAQAHIAHITEDYRNDTGLYVIGDGYHPMFTFDSSILAENPDWQILQATITLNADTSTINDLFKLSSEITQVYFFVYLGTITSTGFYDSYQFSVYHKVVNNTIVIDITSICQLLQAGGNYSFIIYPTMNKTMMRYMPVTLGNLEIFYRKPVEIN